MDPKSEVVIRQKSYLKGQVLFINAPADQLIQHLGPQIQATLWSWNFSEYQAHLRAGLHAHFSVEFPAQRVDQVVIFVPKSRELLNYILHTVAGHLSAGADIFLVGEKKGGVERAAKQLQPFGKTVKLDSARHCQFWHMTLEQTTVLKPLDSWFKHYEIQVNNEKLQIHALPGVFSQDRPDTGTTVLLTYLNQVKSGKLADFGCGAGIIGCYLAKLNTANLIYAMDVDAFALYSTQKTFEHNAIPAEQLHLQAVTGFGDAPTGLDAIISNPPFHQGIHTSYDVSEALCHEARSHLKPGGELWIVANRFLNYPALIEQRFGQCTIKADQQGFKVLYAHA
ncbi:methyltransferase [Acinetobacter sp. WZC-1]|uniref:methyltransferase n=1 Tax=Acinetobacter sp. WZC-1 TaxID=3459034 RepID=UPI00403D92BB